MMESLSKTQALKPLRAGGFAKSFLKRTDYIIDGFVKSLKTFFGVIPAKAGIQCFQILLDACLRRHDGISDFLRVCHYSMFISFFSDQTGR
jgi:hypothetical protein